MNVSSFDFGNSEKVVKIKDEINTVIVNFSVAESWIFYGKCTFEVLKGRIWAFPGALISESQGQVNFKSSCGITVSSMVYSVDEDCVVKIKGVEEDHLMHYFPPEGSYCCPVSSLWVIKEYFPECRPPLLFPDWTTAVSSFSPMEFESGNEGSEKDIKLCVVGDKGVGKSTFCRYVVNALLGSHQSVAYLDMDLGQPEFTPPGIVSLSLIKNYVLGEPFTHINHSPLMMYFVGAISPRDSPVRYSECLVRLYSLYQQQFLGKKVPLVINACGWMQGLGLELLLGFLEQISPIPICIYLCRHVREESILPNEFPRIILKGSIPKQTYTPVSSSRRMSPSDLRKIQLQSYFENPFSKCVCCQVPYAVDWKNFQVCFVGFFVSQRQMFYALNGSVVALCHDPFFSVSDSSSSYPYLLETDDPPAFKCLGLGIIRSVDTSNQLFYICSPVPVECLKGNVNTIVKGMDLEYLPGFCKSCLPFRNKHRVSPYYTAKSLSVQGSGSGAINPRKNIKRAGHQNSTVRNNPSTS